MPWDLLFNNPLLEAWDLTQRHISLVDQPTRQLKSASTKLMHVTRVSSRKAYFCSSQSLRGDVCVYTDRQGAL